MVDWPAAGDKETAVVGAAKREASREAQVAQPAAVKEEDTEAVVETEEGAVVEREEEKGLGIHDLP